MLLLWKRIEEMAEQQACSIKRYPDDEGGAVVVKGPDGRPVMDLYPSAEMTKHEADKLTRAAVVAVLQQLGQILRGA